MFNLFYQEVLVLELKNWRGADKNAAASLPNTHLFILLSDLLRQVKFYFMVCCNVNMCLWLLLSFGVIVESW